MNFRFMNQEKRRIEMLEVKNLKYSYNADYQALKGVSLKIENGEMVALLGKNGAGKSTLFLHLNGIYEPDEGQVFIDLMIRYLPLLLRRMLHSDLLTWVCLWKRFRTGLKMH